MDELSVLIEEEPVTDEIPINLDEFDDIADDLPDVGDDGSAGEEDDVWDGGEDGEFIDDGSTSEDDGFIDGGDTSDEELLGDETAEEDWLVDDEFTWEVDWGCGTVDIDWEILVTDDLIRIYDMGDEPKALDDVPAEEVPAEEIATLDDPAICVLFPCDAIL